MNKDKAEAQTKTRTMHFSKAENMKAKTTKTIYESKFHPVSLQSDPSLH